MSGQIKDLTRRRFGRLKVIELHSVHNGHAYWSCECDCGTRKDVRGSKLTAGRTVSCGCHRADPAIRQASRMQTPAKRRQQIAAMGAAARIEAKR